jgi:nucleotide-binding universal stress UspA family protein
MRVLVALDNSELSETALRAIGPWARETKSEVILITVRHPNTIHDTQRWKTAPAGTVASSSGRLVTGVNNYPSMSGEDRGQAIERAIAESEDPMHQEATKFLAGVDTHYHVEISDNVPAAIAKYAESHDIDFIAIGTHGRKGIAHLLMGSVAEALLRISAVPVMMVREGMRLPG